MSRTLPRLRFGQIGTGGVADELIGPGLASGALSGMAGDATYQGFNMAFGNQNDFDPLETAEAGVIGGALGGLTDGANDAKAAGEAPTKGKTPCPARGSANPKTKAAAMRGTSLHSDKPGNLPEQLRQKFPDTQFQFTKPGQPGQDVQVTGGTHPSDYQGSDWPPGVDFGDLKPDTDSGVKTFNSDQANKWNSPTQMLPYGPVTGRLK